MELYKQMPRNKIMALKEPEWSSCGLPFIKIRLTTLKTRMQENCVFLYPKCLGTVNTPSKHSSQMFVKTVSVFDKWRCEVGYYETKWFHSHTKYLTSYSMVFPQREMKRTYSLVQDFNNKTIMKNSPTNNVKIKCESNFYIHVTVHYYRFLFK